MGRKVPLPLGPPPSGRVVDAKARGRVKGAAILKIVLNQVTVRNNTYTGETNADSRYMKGKGKLTTTMIGGGAGLGAPIGGLAGGAKAALIRAAALPTPGTADYGLSATHDVVR